MSAVWILTVLLVNGCLPIADDPSARERVVDLAKGGNLTSRDGSFVYTLPGDLSGVSQGGEVVVIHDEGTDAWTIVFFDFRGLNHYTGWIYESTGVLERDPLGNQPFKADSIGPNWFRVDAG